MPIKRKGKDKRYSEQAKLRGDGQAFCRVREAEHETHVNTTLLIKSSTQ